MEIRRMKMKNGYIMRQVPKGHPMSDPYGRVYEHRLVMANALGRLLDSKEHVHHINGDKTENRLENLLLFPDTAAHHRHHAAMRRRIIECVCGCGRTFVNLDNRGRQRRYARGHGRRKAVI